MVDRGLLAEALVAVAYWPLTGSPKLCMAMLLCRHVFEIFRSNQWHSTHPMPTLYDESGYDLI